MLRWLFMIVTMVPLMGGWMLVLSYAPQLVNDSMEPWAIVIMLIYVVGILAGYYVFLDRVRPKDDIPHLKAQLEANESRVLSVIPFGVSLGGRSSPDFRVYRARVRRPDGSETLHTVEVEATLFGGGLVRDKSEPHAHPPLEFGG